MKRSLVPAIPVLATLVFGWASSAGAETSANKHLCCDLVAGVSSGACVAQPGPCSPKGDFSVDLSNLMSDRADGGAGAELRPGARDAVFPDGVDGHLFWVATPPWVGFCLMVPDHVSGDVLGCLRVSLSPGVGAASSQVTVPVDSRWGRYQFCYGAPASTSDGPDGGAGGSCAGPDDGLDPTVSVMSSGSCCAPPRAFEEKSGSAWTFGIDQEIPGVPPPVVVERPDAGIVAYLDPDPKLGDMYVSVSGQQCLAEYDEPPMCGTPMLAGAAPSPTAKVAVVVTTTPDGGLSGVALQEAEAGSGGCTMGGERVASNWPGALALLALLAARGPRARH